MSETQAQPDWDMSTYFSKIGGGDYVDFLRSLKADISSLSGDLQSASGIEGAEVPLGAEHKAPAVGLDRQAA